MQKPTTKARGFDLAEKYEELSEQRAAVGYDTIPSATILQAVLAIMKNDCSKKAILSLVREQFVATWRDVVDAVRRALDHFRGCYRIPVSQVLPYNALPVPFA